jgi:hygromycin-B 4-O-kinase
MTLAITNPNAVQLETATAFITSHTDGRATDIESLPAGAWSSPYGYTIDGDRVVIRFNPVREDLAKDALVSSWIADTPNLPVPPIIELGQALGGWYAIAPRIDGEFIDRLSAEGIVATRPSLFTALDALRALPLPGTTGYGGFDEHGRGSHDTWAAFLLDVGTDPPAPRGHGWRRNLETSPTGAATFDRALTHLQTLAPDLPNARALIHADLLHNNVFSRDHQITGIIDWQCGTFGDPVYDIAWLVYCWAYFPAWSGIDVAALARTHLAAQDALDRDFEQRLHAYCIHIGLGDLRYSAYTENWAQVASANLLLDTLIAAPPSS